MKALVIEDHALTKRSIWRMLESDGGTCVMASNAIDAVRMFMEQGPFDLITVDGKLPDGFGWDIIATVRKTGLPVPPILAYTGESATKHRADWNRVGVTEILTKPSNRTTFMDTVRRLLAA